MDVYRKVYASKRCGEVKLAKNEPAKFDPAECASQLNSRQAVLAPLTIAYITALFPIDNPRGSSARMCELITPRRPRKKADKIQQDSVVSANKIVSSRSSRALSFTPVVGAVWN
jgi:hypothetical protein